MMASPSKTPRAAPPPPEPASARLAGGVEAAFRDALTDSFDRLELSDRNMLRFHHARGLPVEQLARLFCSQPGTVSRQLARLRERLLRDTRRGLAARLDLDKPELDRLIDVARGRFDRAIARILRT
jgi:RNA polymerase sigma-70 factor